MNATELFTVGVFVTLLVAVAMSLLVYAAILDGRDAARRQAEEPLLASDHTRHVIEAARAEDEAALAEAQSARNIVETARAPGDFTTLLSAIDRAGLAPSLAGRGPYTLFAPSDSAFAQLPEGAVPSLLSAPATLADVISYHVVPGRLTSLDVARRVSAETFQGEDLTISHNGDVRVDGARLVRGDIEASNGVIHVIDRVLLPARI